MGNHITKATVNILNGVLQGTITFERGLNIISGENGTLKTRLLQTLRGSEAQRSDPTQPLNVYAISPKRNSERRAVESIIQNFRQHNRTWDAAIAERLGGAINDTSFDNYYSLGELYYLVFDHRCRDGDNRRVHMRRVADEFNHVISSVFAHYELLAEWDENLGAPRIQIRKHGRVPVAIEALSLGEQEVLAIIASLDAGKGQTDTYLIDEPEVHLNWHLEERLFEFIDNLCSVHGKQAIVVTHSRTIFKPRFLPKAQFLRWTEDGRVAWGRELTVAQRQRIAGDAIEIIALGQFAKPTFFVEDGAHVELLELLAESFGVEVSVTECRTSFNVRSLFKYQQSVGGWPNAFFMQDGDNQGNPFPESGQFFHLPFYCAENFYLDPDLLAAASLRTPDEIRAIILGALTANRRKIFEKNRFFEFLTDSLRAEHMTFERLKTLDASLIMDDLARRLGVDRRDLIRKYIAAAVTQGHISEMLPAGLLKSLAQPAAAEAVEEKDLRVQIDFKPNEKFRDSAEIKDQLARMGFAFEVRKERFP